MNSGAGTRYVSVIAALMAVLSRRLLREEPDEEAVRHLTAAVVHAVVHMPWHLRVPMMMLTIVFDAGAIFVQGRTFRRCTDPGRYLSAWSGSRVRVMLLNDEAVALPPV